MFKTLIGHSHPGFSSTRQQDAHEFILHLINVLDVIKIALLCDFLLKRLSVTFLIHAANYKFNTLIFRETVVIKLIQLIVSSSKLKNAINVVLVK